MLYDVSSAWIHQKICNTQYVINNFCNYYYRILKGPLRRCLELVTFLGHIGRFHSPATNAAYSLRNSVYIFGRSIPKQLAYNLSVIHPSKCKTTTHESLYFDF